MPIPDYQSLMLPVLKLAEGGEIHVRDATDRLAQQLALTPEERATMLPSGRQTLLSNRMHWAKTYMQKAGLVRSTRRAHFAITDRGREVLASKPARVDNDLLMRFEEFRDFRTKSRDGAFEDNPPGIRAPPIRQLPSQPRRSRRPKKRRTRRSARQSARSKRRSRRI
jgi:restriction system protein